MMSGLKVNFSKSSIIGVNVCPSFLLMVEGFLHCKRGGVPFKYLGLPVGASPRRLSTWEPLVGILRSRLLSWKNRFISFGGRIVLLNSVLNSIPIFFLSYMKMPVGVWKMIVRIQRDFLWGGCSDKRKVPWVRWSEVCKPKGGGGLGVKDIRIFNLSLLGKWRWRLLADRPTLWKDIMVAKYGSRVIGTPDLTSLSPPRWASSWWKDLCLLGSRGSDSSDWIGDRIMRRVGNGSTTLFWRDSWLGHQPLCLLFPRLFLISNNQDGLVAEFGSWVDGVWCWSIPWRRRLFVWEEGLVGGLMMLLQPSILNHDDDGWRWLSDVSGYYSVRSAYVALSEDSSTIVGYSDDQVAQLGKIWRSLAPPKVIAFSWQLLLDRAPTRANLLRRRVILDASLAMCPICGDHEESAIHLFMRCPLAHSVWYEVFSWLGWQLPLPPDLFSLLANFCAFGYGSRAKRGLTLIWHTVLWLIWDMRNGCVFSAKLPDRETLLCRIKSLSWRWFLARSTGPTCLYYEWHVAPFLCITRE